MKKGPGKFRKAYSTGQPALDLLVQDLIEKAGITKDPQFIKEMVITVLKTGSDSLDRGDTKMMNSAMKELRYALKVFYPYQLTRKVAIFGSARTPSTNPDYVIARKFAQEIVKRGWMVITGAATGIMHAGHEGAGREKSFGVNIRLPFEQEANPIIADDPKLINFKYFFTRKLIFVRESDATVCLPGGFGTHDEGFETLTLIQTGKATPRPVVFLDSARSTYWKAWLSFVKNQLVKNKMIDPDDISLFKVTKDPKEAAQYLVDFYKNYHSLRYIGDKLVLRIHRPLTAAGLKLLNQKGAGIIEKGEIVQQTIPFDDEINEPHTEKMVRLSFNFNRRHFSRLYALIEEINRF